VEVKVVDSKVVPENHLFKITFNAEQNEVRANSYNLIDSTTGSILFRTGNDFEGLGTGISGLGVLPVIKTLQTIVVDTIRSGFAPGRTTNATFDVTYSRDATASINTRRDGYPHDFTITFSNTVLDTAQLRFGFTAPIKFRVVAHTPTGDKHLQCWFYDLNNDSTLSANAASPEEIQVLSGSETDPPEQRFTWRIRLKNNADTIRTPSVGDVYDVKLLYPFTVGDEFTFATKSELIEAARANQEFKEAPYVVPNPYVGAASFEPGLFATSGRGDRRMEFRGLPQNCVIRIYTVRGDLVRTLTHNGSKEGYVPWDLRTKDNLDVAPGLFVFHVDAGPAGSHIGKFAIIK
jgi:hypothetical protein